MAHSFYTFSFGCRVNEAEKIALDKKLLALGFLWLEKNPDFYIINSCAVTGKAEREIRQHVYQIRKKFPKTKIIVTGCAATNWKLRNIEVAGVDYLIENSKKHALPTFLQTISTDQQYHTISHMRNSVVKTLMGKNYDAAGSIFDIFPLKRKYVKTDKFLASGRLMVKIQDGCDRFCSYCIVPFVRGLPRSRLAHDIVKEITQHDEHMNEVILTAINTECFGKDTGETLTQLIDAVLKKTSIPNISFGSIHPWSITDEFLKFYQSIISTNRFKPFFHIPIQSGSNKILKLMNRGYTVEEIKGKLKELKGINPKVFIGTDIIVGFPGEGEKEFQETYEFLKTAPIDNIHVFRYSPRPGTAAEKFEKIYGEPPAEEKRRRAKLLLDFKKKNNLLA